MEVDENSFLSSNVQVNELSSPAKSAKKRGLDAVDRTKAIVQSTQLVSPARSKFAIHIASSSPAKATLPAGADVLVGSSEAEVDSCRNSPFLNARSFQVTIPLVPVVVSSLGVEIVVERPDLSFTELELLSEVNAISFETSWTENEGQAPNMEGLGAAAASAVPLVDDDQSLIFVQTVEEDGQFANVDVGPLSTTVNEEAAVPIDLAPENQEHEYPNKKEAQRQLLVSGYSVDQIGLALQAIPKKGEAVWLSPHVLAAFDNADLSCSEDDIRANASTLDRPSPEALARNCLDQLLLSNSPYPIVDLDLVVRGSIGGRSLANRVTLALLKDNLEIFHLASSARRVLFALGSSFHDETQCTGSAGWMEACFTADSPDLLSFELRSAQPNLSVLSALPGCPGGMRSFNVLHYLLARNSLKDTASSLEDSDVLQPFLPDNGVGAGFRLIAGLGDLALTQLQQQQRTDFFACKVFCESLEAFEFSTEDVSILERTCAAVLLLSGSRLIDSQDFAVDVDAVAKTLGVPSERLPTHLGEDWASRLQRQLYQDLFDWVVAKINKKLARSITASPPVALSSVRTIRLFHICPSSTIVAAASRVHGDSFDPLATLETLAFAAPPNMVEMASVLATSGNERYTIWSMGERATSDDGSMTKRIHEDGLLDLLNEPVSYRESVLAAQFPSMYASSTSLLTDLQSKNGMHLVSEMQWESLLAREHTLRFEEVTTKLDAVKGVTEEAATMIKLLQTESARRAQGHQKLPYAEWVSVLSKRMAKAELIQGLERMLNNQDMDVQRALELLRTGLEHPEWAEAQLVDQLKTRLVEGLNKAKTKVDREVFTQVHAVFSSKQALTILPKTDRELVDVLEHIVAFAETSEDAYGNAAASASLLSKLRSKDDIERRQAELDFVERLQARGRVIKPRVESEDEKKGGDIRSLLSQVIGRRMANTPHLKRMVSSLQPSDALLAGSRKVFGRRGSAWLQAAVTPSKRAPRPHRAESRDEMPAELHAKFDTDLGEALRLCRSSSTDRLAHNVIMGKMRLCLNLVHDNAPGLLREAKFQKRVLDQVMSEFGKMRWLDEEDNLPMPLATTRLSVLAFTFFCMDHKCAEISQLLERVDWIQNQRELPEKPKVLLKAFAAGIDELFAVYPHGEERGNFSGYFSNTIATAITNKFASAFEDDVSVELSEDPVRAEVDPRNLSTNAANASNSDSSSLTAASSDHDVEDRVDAQLLPAPPKMYHEPTEEERWRATHVICEARYDFSDPAEPEVYLAIKKGDVLWIPTDHAETGKRCALVASKEWVFVELYVPKDERANFVDTDGQPLMQCGYVPFAYIGYPGY